MTPEADTLALAFKDAEATADVIELPDTATLADPYSDVVPAEEVMTF